MKKKILALILIFSFLPLFTQAAFSVASVKGYVVSSTESAGPAWYVNPVDGKAYSLETGRKALVKLGLGASNKDFYTFAYKMPKRLYGRILLKVQDRGQAYYVHPKTGRLFSLNSEADLTKLINTYGVKISNADLAKIPGAKVSVAKAGEKAVRFNFKYQNKNYYLDEIYRDDTYNSYSKSSKVLVYNTDNPPSNLRESFYALFVKLKAGDTTLTKFASDIKSLGKKYGYEGDQLVEFASTLVEYIPYDNAKLENNIPYFIYETLYKNSGVCSDKTFLLYSILKEWGYGVAILDYPDSRHTAAAVACPKEMSSHDSGYCFIETTNYFPIGIFPQAINKGQAAGSATMANVFDPSYLGKMEMYLKTTGKEYTGISKVKEEVAYLVKQETSIKDKKTDLDAQVTVLEAKQEEVRVEKAKMDQYKSSGNTGAYNNELPVYNALVDAYNSLLGVYQGQQSTYNTMLSEYNQELRAFYQQ